MENIDNIYKIMILYMLDNIKYPLSNSQITNFMLLKDYTTYFPVQQALMDLESSALIIAETSYNRTRYSITTEGRETLNFFENKINDSVKEDILNYFSEHEFEIKEENFVYADYYKASGGGYGVVCRTGRRDKPAMEIKLTVANKEQAQVICKNWKKQSNEVFALLMDNLLI